MFSRHYPKLFWVGGFGDKIFVLPSEGVVTYVERGKTEIENDAKVILGLAQRHHPKLILRIEIYHPLKSFVLSLCSCFSLCEELLCSLWVA